MSKGSRRRPTTVDANKFQENWDSIFSKPAEKLYRGVLITDYEGGCKLHYPNGDRGTCRNMTTAKIRINNLAKMVPEMGILEEGK